MKVNLFHGTNKEITDGTATGTFFTDDIILAIDYMRRKQGSTIYMFTNCPHNIAYLFDHNWEGHYVSRCFIPIDKLTKLSVVYDAGY